MRITMVTIGGFANLYMWAKERNWSLVRRKRANESHIYDLKINEEVVAEVYFWRNRLKIRYPSSCRSILIIVDGKSLDDDSTAEIRSGSAVDMRKNRYLEIESAA